MPAKKNNRRKPRIDRHAPGELVVTEASVFARAIDLFENMEQALRARVLKVLQAVYADAAD